MKPKGFYNKLVYRFGYTRAGWTLAYLRALPMIAVGALVATVVLGLMLIGLNSMISSSPRLLTGDELIIFRLFPLVGAVVAYRHGESIKRDIGQVLSEI